jgi:hypothetical protein
MSREWFLALSQEILKPEHHLFERVGKHGYEFKVNTQSHKNTHHLEHFYFVGLIMGMAVYHGKLFHAYFTLPFYKMLMGKEIVLEDMSSVDEDVYKSLRAVVNTTGVESMDLVRLG